MRTDGPAAARRDTRRYPSGDPCDAVRPYHPRPMSNRCLP
ncbi:hypothetical protein Lcho_0507 [Leptothrix cholodnii SP-6]|uniref:Uncharacterized protein n=1 Tax=Leptothrix cholodnii (strain ATCC 51168 / LMG 8142 / SP-6) TaxID=395495 RepID=B1XY13_LEPCP|nr:hypothetical protein Lcho_0507 [Leptothrix cholodnii SP-6]